MLNLFGTNKKEYVKLFGDVFDSAMAFMGQSEDVEVELEIVTEEEIREINRETRDVDSVTDVLSFPTLDCNRKAVFVKDHPYDVDPQSGKIVLGEIIICMKRAEDQSKEYGHSMERELGFLLAHGLMHLFGYDHLTEEDDKQMRSAQSEILEKIGLTR